MRARVKIPKLYYSRCKITAFLGNDLLFCRNIIAVCLFLSGFILGNAADTIIFVSRQITIHSDISIMDCIIIEDDKIACRGLSLLVEQNSSLNLQATFETAGEAKDWLRANSTDLILLDIDLPEEKGIEFAAGLEKDIMVIFTTAYMEYAVESYELDAVDYLLKPYTAERFEQAIGKALKRKQSAEIEKGKSISEKENEEMIIIRADRKNIPVRLSDIVYIEGIKDYVRLHTDKERIITRSTIKGLLTILPESVFERIHKSYIINRNKLSSFATNEVELNIGDTVVTLPLGEKYKDDFLKKYL